MAAHVFLLNLDEELGLVAERSRSPAATRALAAARAELARTLVPRDGVVFEVCSRHDGALGHAFIPTAAARATLAAAGAVPAPAPDDTVLRRVLRRDFAYVDELGGGAAFTDPEEALAHLRRHAHAGPLRVKRAVGLSGRGHRRLLGPLSAADEGFILRSRDGLVIEPEVRIGLELSLHAHLARDGRLTVGAPCLHATHALGVYGGARRAAPGELDPDHVRELHRSLEEGAEELVSAGYFGPFGVDAYVYESATGFRLRRRSELNARYTMAWGLGMGDVRPDLERTPTAAHSKTTVLLS